MKRSQTKARDGGAQLRVEADSITLAAIRGREYGRLVSDIDSLERRELRRGIPPAEQAQVRRRIADLRLMVAVLKKRKAAECRSLLTMREDLGYDNCYQESLNVGSFARFCLARGAFKTGQLELARFLSKVRTAPEQTSLSQWAIDSLEQLLSSLARRWRPE